jgi:hypothetical protein
MIVYLIVALIVIGAATALMGFLSALTWQTRRTVASTEAFQAAEAGVSRAIFMAQSVDDWSTFTTNGWTLLPSTGAEYFIAFTDKLSSGMNVTATGRKPFGSGYTYRKLQVHIASARPQAFDYAMFGQKVGFHNHMKKNYGLTINSDVWSNEDILLHRGLTLSGNFTACGQILMSTAPSGLDDKGKLIGPTVYSAGNMLDGTPGSPFYAPDKGKPVPEPIPFPVFDFTAASNSAVASGTYFKTAAEFTAYLANSNKATIVKWPATNPAVYGFPAPLPTNSNNKIWLTDSTGKKTGIVSRTTIGATGSSNKIFYVKESISLAKPCNELLVIYGGLVVEGSVTVKTPLELYAGASTPAIAATGKIDITDKDHTDGGGPVNIKGIVYTLTECHIHQSDSYNAVSILGIEVAQYIHNCEWFSFVYAPWMGVTGFSSGTGEQSLTVSRWQELPAGPP